MKILIELRLRRRNLRKKRKRRRNLLNKLLNLNKMIFLLKVALVPLLDSRAALQQKTLNAT